MDILNHRTPRPNRLAIVDVIAMVAIALGIVLMAVILALNAGAYQLRAWATRRYG